MRKLDGCGVSYRGSLAVRAALVMILSAGSAQAGAGSADGLLAIDQHRSSVIERIVATWGVPLAQSSANVSIDELRVHLQALRADELLAASLAGTPDGLRDVLAQAAATSAAVKASAVALKSLGDKAIDDVYTPVTPCRLVETRGTFAAVYQGNGTAAHTPAPFAPNEIRSYTLQGGNNACLAQLPAGLAPSAVQLQVFGMPTTGASGDIEIVPQGSAFGSTATMVYIASIAFNTVSTATRVNLANTNADFSNVCRLAPGGGSWSCTSDRNAKKDFAPVDTADVLAKLAALPITTWRFKTQPDSVTHMGPMAQDFRAAFGLGIDDKTITQVDVNGVTLAAIQALRRLLLDKDEELRALQSRLVEAEQSRAAEIARLRQELNGIRCLLRDPHAAQETERGDVH